MQVFKYYFKLALSMWGSILLFVGIFTMSMIAIISQTSSNSSFTVDKPKIAIFNHDDSQLSDSLVKYLAANSEIVEVKDSDDARREALYFQSIRAAYVIPEGFGQDLMTGQKPQIKTFGGESQFAIQPNALVSNYLRLTEPRILAGVSQAEIVKGVTKDVKQQVKVETHSTSNIGEIGQAKFFMNTLVYAFVGLSIAVVSAVMVLFANDMIRKRNLVGGLSSSSMTWQIFAGNSIFIGAMWSIFMLVATAMYPSAMLSTSGLLFAVGTFLFAMVCLAIAFAIGSFAKNRRAIPGLTNVISLGMAFLCGVFVPIEFLGESVLNISRLLPAYWFVQANEKIAKLNDFALESLQPIFGDWLIVAAFAIGIFGVAFVILQRRKHR